MIVMTTGLTGLMALMRQDKPKGELAGGSPSPIALAPSSIPACRPKRS
jgi:hypothetical protein